MSYSCPSQINNKQNFKVGCWIFGSGQKMNLRVWKSNIQLLGDPKRVFFFFSPFLEMDKYSKHVVLTEILTENSFCIKFQEPKGLANSKDSTFCISFTGLLIASIARIASAGVSSCMVIVKMQ